MTTTKKTTRATTGTRKTATPKKPAQPTAPKVDSTSAPAGDSDNLFLSTMRSGMGALEFATLAVTDLPLNMLQKVGVPSAATDTARDGGRTMLHGVNGTIDTLASQTFKLAGKGASLVTGVVGSVKN